MSTHNIPFSIQKRKLPELSKSVAGFFFPKDLKQIRNNRGKRVISVRATEGLLYFENIKHSETCLSR